MVEILVIVLVSRGIGDMAGRKGYREDLFRWLFVAFWFLTEVIVLVVLLSRPDAGEKYLRNVGIIYGCTFSVGFVYFLFVACLPDIRYSGRRKRKKKKGVLGDMTDDERFGFPAPKQKKQRRYEDDEDERPRRRREPDYDDDDRPRRRRADEDDVDDRFRAPRRGDWDDDEPPRRRDMASDSPPPRNRRDY